VPRDRQTRSRTLAQKALAYGVPGIQVDGNDVLAVLAATREAADAPARRWADLIECVTYRSRCTPRRTTHPSTAARRRSRHGAAATRSRGSQNHLKARELLTDADIERSSRRIAGRSSRLADTQATMERLDDPGTIFDHHYADLPRHLREQRDACAAQRAGGGGLTMAERTMAQALNLALTQEMERDDAVVVLGEDVGVDGGVFRITEGLLDKYGETRVIDTPLAEAAIVGVSIGMAAYGLKPVCEMQFSGFSYLAMHQLESHAARLRWRSRGRFPVPMVVRMPYGGGVRALEHHSESKEAYFAHTPGLKVVIPSGPRNARALLASAIRDPDPVIFMEPKRIYRAFREEVPDEPERPCPSAARNVRDGDDVTLVAYGSMLRPTLEAAERLADEDGVEAEVIDLLTHLAAGRRRFMRVGAAHRPGGDRARGAAQLRPGRRDDSRGCREVVLVSRGAGRARDRLRRAGALLRPRAALPAGRRRASRRCAGGAEPCLTDAPAAERRA
jgi:pyruvate dehydrogenase E1 component beta subunit